jgi:hypothetical protein
MLALALLSVTFTRDIAPILYKHCAPCHHPGAAAPFSLLTYADAAKRAALIAKVTSSRYMPPWKPVDGYGHFRGERRLADREIGTIRAWAASGAPEGDRAHLSRPPKFSAAWQLGVPDLVAEMPAPFPLPADGPDLYECFVIPLQAPQQRYVRAAEFRPGNAQAVHHALMFLDPLHTAAQRGSHYPCFGTPGFLPSGGLGGWTPGAGAIVMPPGTATTLHKNSDLIVQIHFHPTGKPESVRASVGLYFADRPPTRHLLDLPLVSRRIDIPPGASAYKASDYFTLPVDVDAVGIVPHAHYICKDMKGWATLPNGRKLWLIWIRDWDFNWQEQYHYATPIRLPAGTRLEMEFTYDNSDANPRNPNHPPRRVVWGPESTDEMAGLHVQAIPVRNSDLEELTQSLWGKLVRTLGTGGLRK